jgi:hypothetical protein
MRTKFGMTIAASSAITKITTLISIKVNARSLIGI